MLHKQKHATGMCHVTRAFREIFNIMAIKCSLRANQTRAPSNYTPYLIVRGPRVILAV